MTIKTLATGLPLNWPMPGETEWFLLVLPPLPPRLLLALSQTIYRLLGMK